MNDNSFFIWFLLGTTVGLAWFLYEQEPQRLTIKSDQYGWAAEVCEDRGWRTIIINHRNQLTVKCIGGGVHLYDASNRRVPDGQ